MSRSINTDEFKPWVPESVTPTAEDFRDRAAFLQRELRTSQRWCTGYRRLALLGWLAFTGTLLWQSDVHAETLPQDSIACVDEAAWSEQAGLVHAGIADLAEGCVFTSRDFQVRVETQTVFSGSSVWVDLADKEQLVWVNGEVLRP